MSREDRLARHETVVNAGRAHREAPESGPTDDDMRLFAMLTSAGVEANRAGFKDLAALNLQLAKQIGARVLRTLPDGERMAADFLEGKLQEYIDTGRWPGNR